MRSSDERPRVLFAERFAQLYIEAGDPPLKAISEAVARARRTDDRGRPVRANVQRLSDWRRGRNIPARFAVLGSALEVLIALAKKRSGGSGSGPLYDMTAWHTLWREALAQPVGEAAPRAAGTRLGGRPRQLPLDIATFTGRDRELSTIAGLLDPASAGTGPVVVVHGPPGVGKSALAVRAASRSSGQYPDGDLYVNLRGATPGTAALDPAEALGRFLRALGLPAAEVPADAEEAAALFRSQVADRRLTILLDNAATAAQVRPLLPGTSRSAVLITSRTGLATLEGATHLRLGPLEPDAAQEMLARLIGTARTAEHPPDTRRLAELCDHLPLGLQIAASRLKTRPDWTVGTLVERLADERYRLSELDADESAVRGGLELSHAGLARSANPADRAAALALCMSGLVPVTGFDAHLVASLIETTAIEADRAIERLLDAHLIEVAAPGRFHMHDLIRLFARELAEGTVLHGQANAAITRVLGHYVATAYRAAQMAYPNRIHYSVPDIEARAKAFGDPGEAHRWLEDERANLRAMIRRSWGGSDEHARLGLWLTLALHWHLIVGCYLDDAVELNVQAVAQARRLGDRYAQAMAHSALGAGYMQLGRLGDAETALKAELAICRETGNRVGEQRAQGNLGVLYLLWARPEEAIVHLEGQLATAQEIKVTVGEMFARHAMGKAYRLLGRYTEAIELVERALAWYEETGDDYSASATLEQLGLIHIDLGRLEAAADLLSRSRERARQGHHRGGEVEALIALARTWRLRGAPDKALDCAEEAIAIASSIGAIRLGAQARAEHSAVRGAADVPDA
ncbi:tetratricopeptide repeat protein [Spongiactinospora rosea]|nr:tetratricopeptide repeat protein [Spongiactinospora rosea]